jgi:hypothetical protein
MVPSGSGMIMPADMFAASRAALENTSAGSSMSGDGAEADAALAESRNYINNYTTQQAIAKVKPLLLQAAKRWNEPSSAARCSKES